MTLQQANRAIFTIDGSRYSGSGTIVRQAVAFDGPQLSITGVGFRLKRVKT